MKGKVKEFAERASLKACYDSQPIQLIGDEIEKFADLIITACASIAFCKSGTLENAIEIRGAIEEYFGVQQ